MNIRPGEPHPLGTTWDGTGVNFALFSAHATNVELCLFDAPGATREAARLPLPARTDHVWHGYLSDIRAGQLYGYRVSGPYDPSSGHRFNPAKLLLDPYAKQIGRTLRWSDALFGHEDAGTAGEPRPDARDSAPFAPLAAVPDRGFDWGSDRPPRIPWHETVIYEVHAKGFTARHPEVSAHLRGTYLGLASEAAIRHFVELGVTAIELLPVQHRASEARLLAGGLTNYWGYNTLAYFAPDARYATSPERAVADFKTMVRALHEAGLEVILDVVYNHTAEGDRHGPTLSLRGIDNRSYYRLDPRDPAAYLDFTGCGNTLDATHPRARQLITDSLRYWVSDMHVDGFRFDLASALAREAHGEVHTLGSCFDVIRRDPVLSRVKLIAEPWDLGADGYQAGNFPAGWSEWNARYRDTVRRFWRGDGGQAADLATRLAGSSDLYEAGGRGPHASINFVTAHDGFTLADLVSYDAKHNEANGEANRDGSDANLSWNCGVEGTTDDPGIARLRARQKRNFMATLLLSQGVPMICGGDEIGRTQAGNNNAYCQDNGTSWFDWSLAPADRELLTFVRAAIDVRRRHPALRSRRFLRQRQGVRAADVVWLDPHGGEMTDAAWGAPFVRCLGMRLAGDVPDETDDRGAVVDDTLLVLLNAHDDAVAFTLPAAERRAPWLLVFDTAQPDAGQSAFSAGRPYRLQGRSVAVLRAPRNPAATLS